MDFRLFIPITKVDVAKRLVYGTIAEEVPDKSGEIMDYQSAKPEFEAWSAAVGRASNGKSAGNLRAMHGSVAAGRLDRIVFDDKEKRIATVAKVVDDTEWQKVLEGVYTGFSMGGKYKKRWRDPKKPELTRYTPEPMEVSLVDNPCIPSATFEVIKDDGSSELRKFNLKQSTSKDRSVMDLAKYGARHSREDLSRVQLMHDTSVDLGATCGGDEDADPDYDLSDSLKSMRPQLAKLAGDIAARTLEKLAPRLDALGRRIEALEAMPMPGGPYAPAFAVAKSHDLGGRNLGSDPVGSFEQHLDTLAPAQRAHVLAKLALKNPMSR
ncbi:MAG: hypothetical protein ABSD74_05650 [Rhizomicrobium sp.]